MKDDKEVQYYEDWHCGCGCDGKMQIKEYHKSQGIPMFISGHNRVGVHYDMPSERKETIRLATIEGMKCPEVIEKMRMPRSEEGRKSIILSTKTRKTYIPWNKGLTKETDNRIKQVSEKVSIALTGKPSLRKGKKNPKTSSSLKKLWQDLLFRERMLKSTFKALAIHPNKPETVLNNLLQKMYPNEWKFVGDGSFLIGYKSPDFINVNGQKKIIEMYGDYWHRKEKETDGAERKAHFKKYGFDMLVIWEHELKDLNIVIDKIKHFIVA